MAMGWQLDQHEKNQKNWEKRVKAVKKERDQSLLFAQAQQAVMYTDSALRAEPPIILEREGFDPATPEAVLNDAEKAHLEVAQLVVGAIKKHFESSLRLQNKKSPRIDDTYVIEGEV